MANAHRSVRLQKLGSGKGHCLGCKKPAFTAYCERCMPSSNRSCYSKLTILATARFDEHLDSGSGMGAAIEMRRRAAIERGDY